jgi:type IV pilus assembly protein PilP
MVVLGMGKRTGGLMRFALLAAVAALAGCGKPMTDLEQRVAEIKGKRGAPLEPLPRMRTFETFEYKAETLRDPFSPSIDQEVASGGDGPRPDMNRPREPLESYPLDTLDMVGTLGLSADVTALVKDTDGVIHRVRPDNYLGQNYGRVTGIYEDRIEIVELIPNGVGGWIERPAAIALDDE